MTECDATKIVTNTEDLNKSTHLIHITSQCCSPITVHLMEIRELVNENQRLNPRRLHSSTWVLKPLLNAHTQDMTILSIIISYKPVLSWLSILTSIKRKLHYIYIKFVYNSYINNILSLNTILGYVVVHIYTNSFHVLIQVTTACLVSWDFVYMMLIGSFL